VKKPTRILTLLVLAACSSSNDAHDVAGADGGGVSTAMDAASAAETSSASDAHAASDGPALVDASDPDVDARTIAPVMPGTWRDISPPSLEATLATTTPCTDLQFDPGNPATLYAMYGSSGIWKSIDAGTTWNAIGDLPTPVSLGRVRIDPGDSTHLYATGSVNGSSLGFWVSHDGGQTFTMPAAFTAGASGSSPTWSTDVYNIAVDPTDFDHFLLTFHQPWPCCGEDAGILESQDGGTTFTPHTPPAGMNHGNGVAFLYQPALAIGTASTWLVGAGYDPGLFRTSDGGATWTSVSTLQDNHGGFDAHYSAQGYLYIGSSMGVYRSTDNGQTWQNESQGSLSTWTYSVIGDGKRLYTSPAFVGQPFNQPFFVSTEGGADEGTQWTAMSTQVIPNGPWRMVFDSANGIIYGANWSSGAWALTVAD
jgi:photosystem II stability/assembly factor-like uncharacterized protein